MMQQEQSSPGAENQILEAEAREAEARIRPDFLTLDELWSERLLITGTEDLIFTKHLIRARLESGTLRYRIFERRSSKIVLHNGFAIVSGNESVGPTTGPDAGNLILCSYMNVWALEDGNWRLVGRHVHAINKSPADYL